MSSVTILAAAIGDLDQAQERFWESLQGEVATKHWRDERRDALVDLVRNIEDADYDGARRMELFGDEVLIVRRYRLMQTSDREQGKTLVPLLELAFHYLNTEEAPIASLFIDAEQNLGAVASRRNGKAMDPVYVARLFEGVVELIVSKRFIL